MYDLRAGKVAMQAKHDVYNSTWSNLDPWLGKDTKIKWDEYLGFMQAHI